jgi:hypothetical protein
MENITQTEEELLKIVSELPHVAGWRLKYSKKWKDCSYRYVCDNDPSYIQWMILKQYIKPDSKIYLFVTSYLALKKIKENKSIQQY